MKLSRYALAACCLFLGSTLLYFPRWTLPASESTFGWDAGGYYWYLPATFIYKDLRNHAFADSIIERYKTSPTFDHTITSDNGAKIIKYSAGMAVLYSPAFFIAHAIAKASGYPADGFSKPYGVAAQLWSLLVAMTGLWALRRLLLRYYADGIVAITLLLLTIGTNYLNYASIDGLLSHSYLFTLCSLLLLATDRFYERPSARAALGIGCTLGLMVLTRPTEASAVILPLLWKLDSLSLRRIRERFAFYFRQFRFILLAVIAAGAIASLQVIYWKVVGGHWLIYSYGEQGFYWTRPHVWDYALSYRSGWLTYTPMFFLGLAGIVPFLVRGRNRVALCLFALVSFYVVSAWDMWWYSGTGGRAMIQYYPVWMFFFASLLTAVRKSRLASGITAVLIGVFAYVNIWMTYQQHVGGLYDSEAMSRAYYWKVVGRWTDPMRWVQLKDSRFQFEGPIAAQELLYQNNLADTTKSRAGATSSGTGIVLDRSSPESSPFYTAALPELHRGDWLRATATFSCAQKEWTTWKMLQFIFRSTKSGKTVGESVLRAHRLLEDGLNRDISVDLQIEDDIPDSVAIHFWYPGDREKGIRVENLRVFRIR